MSFLLLDLNIYTFLDKELILSSREYACMLTYSLIHFFFQPFWILTLLIVVAILLLAVEMELPNYGMLDSNPVWALLKR